MNNRRLKHPNSAWIKIINICCLKMILGHRPISYQPLAQRNQNAQLIDTEPTDPTTGCPTASYVPTHPNVPDHSCAGLDISHFLNNMLSSNHSSVAAPHSSLAAIIPV